MLRTVFAVAAVAAVAGSASAQLAQSVHPASTKDTADQFTMVVPATRGTVGTVVTLDIGGANSWDPIFDPSNDVFAIDLAAAIGLPSGSPVTMTAVGWNTFLTTVGESWGREARFYFDDNIAPDGTGLVLRPNASAAPVTGANDTSGGLLDLTSAAIPNIALPNGVLRLEFFESFDDVADAIDANWLAGSQLFIGVAEIPAPGAVALAGIAGLVGLRRRR